MDINLTVGGSQYGGWKNVTVRRSMEAICGSYDLGFSDKWAAQASAWPIRPGDECTVQLLGTTVITGYVDSREVSYGAKQHNLSVSGRDKAADIVDSSAVLGKWQFKNQNVLQICQALAKPFGIPVNLAQGVTIPKPQADFPINPGESAFEAIDRICRLSGMLPISDSMGGILLTVGTTTQRASTPLVEGVNILSASVNVSHESRFNKYIVGGQHSGSDELNGKSAASVQAEAFDNVVRAGRVLYVRPEGIVTVDAARRRAQWEASVRAARAVEVSVTVQGWAQESGELWPINTLVYLNSPMLDITGEMLIAEVEYGLSDSNGTTTNLSLKRPQAYLPEPPTKGKSKGEGVGSNPWQE